MKGCGRTAGEIGEWGNGWTERPMWTICRPVCSTLSHRDSPVLDSRPLLSCSPFPLLPHLPMPPFLPRHTPRPLTFYHHNRYIIPRSVFYSRVTPWNAFVRDIVRLSLLPVLYFPLSSFFFSAGYLIGERSLFSFFRYGVFFKIRLWCRSCWRSLHAVELNNVSMGIIARSFIDSRF